MAGYDIFAKENEVVEVPEEEMVATANDIEVIEGQAEIESDSENVDVNVTRIEDAITDTEELNGYIEEIETNPEPSQVTLENAARKIATMERRYGIGKGAAARNALSKENFTSKRTYSDNKQLSVDSMKAFAKEAGGTIKERAKKLLDWIVGLFKKAWAKAKSIVSGITGRASKFETRETIVMTSPLNVAMANSGESLEFKDFEQQVRDTHGFVVNFIDVLENTFKRAKDNRLTGDAISSHFITEMDGKIKNDMINAMLSPAKLEMKGSTLILGNSSEPRVTTIKNSNQDAVKKLAKDVEAYAADVEKKGDAVTTALKAQIDALEDSDTASLAAMNGLMAGLNRALVMHNGIFQDLHTVIKHGVSPQNQDKPEDKKDDKK